MSIRFVCGKSFFKIESEKMQLYVYILIFMCAHSNEIIDSVQSTRKETSKKHHIQCSYSQCTFVIVMCQFREGQFKAL